MQRREARVTQAQESVPRPPAGLAGVAPSLTGIFGATPPPEGQQLHEDDLYLGAPVCPLQGPGVERSPGCLGPKLLLPCSVSRD